MSRTLPLALFLLACGPGAIQPLPAGYTGPTPPPAAEPPPDEPPPNAGQRVVATLGTLGYTCAAEDTRWSCSSANTSWPFYVSYSQTTPELVSIWLDSFEFRAFGKQCPEFTNALKDLSNGRDLDVTCDDGSQQFRFRTYFPFADNLDLAAWLRAHEQHRSEGVRLLATIDAIRKR